MKEMMWLYEKKWINLGRIPLINKDGEIFTLSEKAGYFKLGPKTIIVPEQTSIHQNYPNLLIQLRP